MRTALSMLPLSPRQEDYLEAILALDGGAGARPTDLARRLKVRAPSVTAGLRTLAAKGVVRHARYGAVTLTPRGRLAARAVTARHEALRHFLQRVLTVSAGDAEDAACRMEHALPPRVLRKIVSFLDFVDHCPHGGGGYIDSFRRHCSRTPVGPACVSCDQPARQARRAARPRRTS